MSSSNYSQPPPGHPPPPQQGDVCLAVNAEFSPLTQMGTSQPWIAETPCHLSLGGVPWVGAHPHGMVATAPATLYPVDAVAESASSASPPNASPLLPPQNGTMVMGPPSFCQPAAGTPPMEPFSPVQPFSTAAPDGQQWAAAGVLQPNGPMLGEAWMGSDGGQFVSEAHAPMGVSQVAMGAMQYAAPPTLYPVDVIADGGGGTTTCVAAPSLLAGSGMSGSGLPADPADGGAAAVPVAAATGL